MGYTKELEDATIASIVKLAGTEVINLGEGSAPIAITRDGTVIDLSEHLGTPLRTDVINVLARTESFVAYVNRFKTPDTLIFASLKNAKVEAIIDYDSPTGPAHRQHRAELVMARTPEWTKWKNAHDKPLGQVALADLLEDLTLTISEPPAARITEMVLAFQDTRTLKFESKVNRTTGGFTFVHADESNTKGQLKVPDSFEVDIRPFEASEPIRAIARLRYKVDDGRVTFRVVFDRFEDIEREAFASVLAAVEAGTQLAPLVQP